jgi:hypothetical protein
MFLSILLLAWRKLTKFYHLFKQEAQNMKSAAEERTLTRTVLKDRPKYFRHFSNLYRHGPISLNFNYCRDYCKKNITFKILKLLTKS